MRFCVRLLFDQSLPMTQQPKRSCAGVLTISLMGCRRSVDYKNASLNLKFDVFPKFFNQKKTYEKKIELNETIGGILDQTAKK